MGDFTTYFISTKKMMYILLSNAKKPCECIVLDYIYLYDVPGSFHVLSTNGQKVDVSELQPMTKWLYLSTCAKELRIYMQIVSVIV